MITTLAQGTHNLARGTQCSARNQMENGLIVEVILSTCGAGGEELECSQEG